MKTIPKASSTLFFLASALVFAAKGQQSLDLFNPVPPAQRESLRRGVSKDAMYQTNRQWPEMYKLYDNKRNISLEQFVHDMNTRIRLLEFTPYTVTYIPPAEYWRIDGCARFAGNVGDNGMVDAVITARLLSGGWRLSEVTISPRKGSQGCTSDNKK